MTLDNHSFFTGKNKSFKKILYFHLKQKKVLRWQKTPLCRLPEDDDIKLR
jgi:hypothetical protein